MGSYVVGSVPYLNAKPLVGAIEEHPDRFPIRVEYAVPSQLPERLESGKLDCVLASSIEALLPSERRIAAGLCIASRGPVDSVKLFSRVPFSEIRSLALDRSSMTSNALAQILLAERYDCRPTTRRESPDLASMLSHHDAAVLIGDIGLRESHGRWHVLDLGEAWSDWTGRPFVWALWIGKERLTPELASHLAQARIESCLGAPPANGRADWEGRFEQALGSPAAVAEHRAQVLRSLAKAENWPIQLASRYLSETIIYDLGSEEWAGLQAFGEAIERHGLVSGLRLPDRVEGGPAMATAG